MIATIVPTEIHWFIQDHDGHALSDTKQDHVPLFLETLGIQEFCHIAFLACTEDITIVFDRLKTMLGELTIILEQDDEDMDTACEKSRLIAFVVKRQPSPGSSQTLARNVAKPSQIHKNPMFRTVFFKKEDLQMIDIQPSGNHGNSRADGRGSEGTLSFVPLLPPCKCELDLASNDGRVWAISNFNLLAPFLMEIWKILASVTDEEIEECKRRALLANSPTKRILSQTWGLRLFSTGKYDYEELVIVRTKLDMETGLKQEKNHHNKLFN